MYSVSIRRVMLGTHLPLTCQLVSSWRYSAITRIVLTKILMHLMHNINHVTVLCLILHQHVKHYNLWFCPHLFGVCAWGHSWMIVTSHCVLGYASAHKNDHVCFNSTDITSFWQKCFCRKWGQCGNTSSMTKMISRNTTASNQNAIHEQQWSVTNISNTPLLSTLSPRNLKQTSSAIHCDNGAVCSLLTSSIRLSVPE